MRGVGMGVTGAVLVLATAGAALAAEPIELTFAVPPPDGTDAARTLGSIVVARDLGEPYGTGGLYLVTQVGDRTALCREANQQAIDEPLLGQSWRYCSVFAGANGGRPIMGRNWDNQNVGSIIVSLYRPPGGHASLSFARSMDLSLPLNVRLDRCGDDDLGQRLLLAPFHAMDGVNERGLAVATAGVKQRRVGPVPGRELTYIPYLVRQILDGAATVDEAVTLVQKHVPFDLDAASLNCHLLVADATGRTAVLEYEQDQWHVITDEAPWLIMTNKQLRDVPATALMESCWRYRTLSEQLPTLPLPMDGPTALAQLHSVQQTGTTWSTVYSLQEREALFCVYQDWEKVYRVGL